MTIECVSAPLPKRRTPFSIEPVGDAGGGEHHVALGHVVQRVFAVEVGDAPLAGARRSRRRCGTAAGPGSGRRCSAAPPPPARLPARRPSRCRCRCPVAGSRWRSRPTTSPSPISMMRAPASRTLAISSAWRGRSRMQTTRSATSTFLALARSARFCRRRLVEIDHARRAGRRRRRSCPCRRRARSGSRRARPSP